MRNARVRDAIVELPNGDLLMPLHGFRWQRTMPDIASAERERAFVLWSPNRGKTWHYYGTMGYDPAEIIHYHEPGLVRLHDGRLLGLMRTQRWPSPADPGEQMGPPSGYIFTALSEDDGMTCGLVGEFMSFGRKVWCGDRECPSHDWPSSTAHGLCGVQSDVWVAGALSQNL